MNLKPLADRVIVKALPNEERTKSGIIIPDTAKEKPQEGLIVAVGPGKYDGDDLVPMSVKVNDRVIYSKYAGTEIKYDGNEYLILRESDVLAIIG
ncbi:MAG: co-chaperone GroES [Peptococcaceae bacterium]|nr:co-chaperone GroES [Peptococcaceae bacterium]